MYARKYLGSFIIVALAALWCELGYYHFTFLTYCPGWPSTDLNSTKILVIADTHIMGKVKSVWIDKVRREWQMRQAFSIANTIYQPDVIVFLGDLLDEASFASDSMFRESIADFEKIFVHMPHQERIIVPGNHDVGFHDRMIMLPYFLNRFSAYFKSTRTIELLRLNQANHLNIVASNSMAFYNDTCDFCSSSVASTNLIAERLDNQEQENPESFSSPILFHHIPFYRYDDKDCELLGSDTSDKNREGIDVTHKIKSRFVLGSLKPRVVISGHSHLYCRTMHKIGEQTYEEITVPSFNHKYAQTKPGLLLLTANKKRVMAHHCYLVNEWLILLIYIVALVIVCLRFTLAN